MMLLHGASGVQKETAEPTEGLAANFTLGRIAFSVSHTGGVS
jgi:hypothetical protein